MLQSHLLEKPHRKPKHEWISMPTTFFFVSFFLYFRSKYETHTQAHATRNRNSLKVAPQKNKKDKQETLENRVKLRPLRLRAKQPLLSFSFFRDRIAKNVENNTSSKLK